MVCRVARVAGSVTDSHPTSAFSGDEVDKHNERKKYFLKKKFKTLLFMALVWS